MDERIGKLAAGQLHHARVRRELILQAGAGFAQLCCQLLRSAAGDG